MAIMLIWPEVSWRRRPCSRLDMVSKPLLSVIFPASNIVFLEESTSRGSRPGVSGHAVADLELRLRPGFLIKDFTEDLHRLPDLGKRCVQRGKTEAHDPRLTVVTDHTTGDQGLNNRITFGMFEADMAATPGMFARGDQGQFLGGAALLDQFD